MKIVTPDSFILLRKHCYYIKNNQIYFDDCIVSIWNFAFTGTVFVKRKQTILNVKW